MNYLLSVICFTLFVGLSLQQGPNQSVNYTAAAIEFAPNNNSDLNARFRLNTQQYVQLIASTNADVIVFPEYTFNQVETAIVVPRQEDLATPCGNNTFEEALRDISCAARAARRFVVISALIRTNCTEEAAALNDTRPCTIPANHTNIYNTAIVFDRNGVIITVYRKFNLLNETGVRRPLTRDWARFNTDFGITFGVFVGSDLLFTNPLAAPLNNVVRHFVAPTRWNSELPFLSAVQIQQSWSYANNVNLIVAGANQPNDGNTGTGIYAGRIGALRSVMSETPESQVFIAQIPREPGIATVTEDLPARSLYSVNRNKRSTRRFQLQLLRENLNQHNVAQLHFDRNTVQNGSVCHNEFCCHYDIEVVARPIAENSASYSYIVAAFNGRRLFRTVPTDTYLGFLSCGIIACTESGSLQSCGTRFERENVAFSERFLFNRINITARFQNTNLITVMPNTLNNNLLTLNPNEFIYSTNNLPTQPNASQLMDATLVLARPRSDILTFSLFARNFPADSESSGNKLVTGFILVALGVVINIFYY